ncbi:hypothetical protein Q7526_07105 [Glaesserella parasuis]|uniref:Uncharacterized protein n=2 Tax=Glaesserella parasuis TaxID=738 RepID=A0A836MG98_GLAPU|nr:hypothetical protein [Glaesserella parasuis]KDB49179.1 hypothetical protein HPS10_00710 [Glaesserella parasuis HPS10]MCT8541639.1 hypothetical protein [Glaesserella parasuis]MCT8546164.1 hypothetical protein [Glaesserella parasuis]MCT8550712.1 hypothetical protein [Glaesserella parasuis]MCT8563595.1 hypothetical protein [Glaesserella parasuis]
MGILDLFRKKNDVTKSVSSSISTTNKILNQLNDLPNENNNTEKLRKEFWDNLSPMWRRILGGNYRCQKMIKENGKIFHSTGSLAEDIYTYGGRFENSPEYPEGLFDITEIKYPYKVSTVHSMFGDTSMNIGEGIKGKFITELPDFSLFKNLEELVIYQDKINDYSNLSTIKNLSKLTLVFPNSKSSDILESLPSNIKELNLGHLEIDDIYLLSNFNPNKVILGGCRTKNGLLANPNNPDAEVIRDLLPNSEVIIRNIY